MESQENAKRPDKALKKADENLLKHKDEREVSGVRSPRGEEPKGFTQTVSQSKTGKKQQEVTTPDSNTPVEGNKKTTTSDVQTKEGRKILEGNFWG